MGKPALINIFRYEYACGGLVNISYRNINHPFIGNLSAVEDGNRRLFMEMYGFYKDMLGYICWAYLTGPLCITNKSW